jgi:hypothetical protein
MSAPFQFLSQLANAFGGPAQGRLRIASGHRLDETFQVGAQGLICVSGALASPTGFANAARDLPAVGSFQLPGALCNPLLWLAGKLRSLGKPKWCLRIQG